MSRAHSAMFGIHRSAQSSFLTRSALLGIGLALASCGEPGHAPAVRRSTAWRAARAAGATDCRLLRHHRSSHDVGAPTRSAALVVRADARNGRTSGGLSDALSDIDRAIALDGKNARAWRLRGDLMREGRRRSQSCDVRSQQGDRARSARTRTPTSRVRRLTNQRRVRSRHRRLRPGDQAEAGFTPRPGPTAARPSICAATIRRRSPISARHCGSSRIARAATRNRGAAYNKLGQLGQGHRRR